MGFRYIVLFSILLRLILTLDPGRGEFFLIPCLRLLGLLGFACLSCFWTFRLCFLAIGLLVCVFVVPRVYVVSSWFYEIPSWYYVLPCGTTRARACVRIRVRVRVRVHARVRARVRVHVVGEVSDPMSD
jgi:hypothetical protein